MAAAAAAEKILTLRISDNEVFEVEESVAKKSQTIKNMLEDECAGVIPLANVHSKILTKVLEYCRKHAQTKAADGDSDKDAKAADAELGTFDVDFTKVDQATLFDLILIMRERLTSPSHLDHEDTRQHDHEDTVQQVNLFNAMDIQTLKKILKPLGKDVGKKKEELARRADFEFDSKLKTLTRPALRKFCEKNKVLFVATDSRSDLVSKLIYLKKKMMEKSVRSLGSTTAKKGCDGVIPLPNVHSKILTLVIEYCTHHTQTKAANTDKYCRHSDADKDFDKKFVDVKQNTLFDLILAAGYLDIKDLLDLTCETLANMIRGKKPEEIRKTFHIKNDLTKEEEEIRRDYQWAFAPPWQLMQSNQQG